MSLSRREFLRVLSLGAAGVAAERAGLGRVLTQEADPTATPASVAAEPTSIAMAEVSELFAPGGRYYEAIQPLSEPHPLGFPPYIYRVNDDVPTRMDLPHALTQQIQVVADELHLTVDDKKMVWRESPDTGWSVVQFNSGMARIRLDCGFMTPPNNPEYDQAVDIIPLTSVDQMRGQLNFEYTDWTNDEYREWYVSVRGEGNSPLTENPEDALEAIDNGILTGFALLYFKDQAPEEPTAEQLWQIKEAWRQGNPDGLYVATRKGRWHLDAPVDIVFGRTMEGSAQPYLGEIVCCPTITSPSAKMAGSSCTRPCPTWTPGALPLLSQVGCNCF